MLWAVSTAHGPLRMRELLDADKILSFIEPNRRRLLAQFDIFPSLPSTNSYLLDLAREPLSSGYVCMAEEQSAGRGRLGKQWDSPQGNIYCSLLWNFPIAHADISQLSLAIGVMIVRALEELGIKQGCQLKWPNDIYYDNRKLAGILIEALPTRREVYPVVIGVGLNVQIQEEERIGLQEILNTPVSRNKVIGLMLNELVAGLGTYIDKSFSSFCSDYMKYDMLRGKYVVIRTGKLEITGIAEGINSSGELVVRDQNSQDHMFRCGEVSVVLTN
jgi:BirA family transcriptional regulator, biotin operon repressor / biotin---[acetyl-CoA-carboxylase] ligase